MRINSSYKKHNQAKQKKLVSVSASDAYAACSAEFKLKHSAVQWAVLLLTGCIATPAAYVSSKRMNAWFEIAKGFR